MQTHLPEFVAKFHRMNVGDKCCFSILESHLIEKHANMALIHVITVLRSLPDKHMTLLAVKGDCKLKTISP